jgi:flagellar basal-body rod protein FlgG
MYSAVSGGLSAMTRLDAIADNLANASTPGFKALRVVQSADFGASRPAAGTNGVPPLNRGTLMTDFSQGPLEHNGNPLNLALSGPGFFVVDGERGERLTRRGNFVLDSEGFLATTDGARVQGEGGDLRLGERGGPIEVGDDGTIRVNNNPVGKLRVVTVANPSTLAREGGTSFVAGGQALGEVSAETRVAQGSLEGANLSPIQGLVSMIEAMRGFEAYMRAADRLDQIESRAISDVGRV